jgi:hypothetical protein
LAKQSHSSPRSRAGREKSNPPIVAGPKKEQLKGKVVKTFTEKDIDLPEGMSINIVGEKVTMEFEPTKYSPKGRKLRKEFERPHPELPPNALENRNRKPVAFTLPPDLIRQLNDRCEELDVSRTSFVEAAIRRALAPS